MGKVAEADSRGLVQEGPDREVHGQLDCGTFENDFHPSQICCDLMNGRVETSQERGSEAVADETQRTFFRCRDLDVIGGNFMLSVAFDQFKLTMTFALCCKERNACFSSNATLCNGKSDLTR